MNQVDKYFGIALPLPTRTPTILSLKDTPVSYSGFGGYTLRVNSSETGIEFIPENFSYDYVESIIFIPPKQQMVVYNEIEIEGFLEVGGKLILLN